MFLQLDLKLHALFFKSFLERISTTLSSEKSAIIHPPKDGSDIDYPKGGYPSEQFAKTEGGNRRVLEPKRNTEE